MTQNESYYRSVMGAIGVTMLLFLLLINVFAVLALILQGLLLVVAPHPVATVGYQLFYAAGYMLSFMLPVLLLRGRIRAARYSYQSMQALNLPSPWTLLLIPAVVTVIFSASRLNASLVNIVRYAPLSSDSLLPPGAVVAPDGYEWVLDVIVSCVVPGFCEEFLFRGAIQTNCRPFGRVNAVLIAAFFFSMMHQNPAQLLYTFVAGIFLGIVYEKTNSLLACSVLHVFNNLAATCEDMLFHGIEDYFTSSAARLTFEIALFIPGVVGLIIFLIHLSRSDRTIRGGIFERELPASDGYASHPIAPAAARRLFLRPSVVIFLILTLLQVTLLLMINYGILSIPMPR